MIHKICQVLIALLLTTIPNSLLSPEMKKIYPTFLRNFWTEIEAKQCTRTHLYNFLPALKETLFEITRLQIYSVCTTDIKTQSRQMLITIIYKSYLICQHYLFFRNLLSQKKEIHQN